jgi:hypothetical protein
MILKNFRVTWLMTHLAGVGKVSDRMRIGLSAADY